MYSFYNYAKSFFYNSPMASSGLPSEAELELLEPWRGQIPDRVFTDPWLGNETSGYGRDRDVIRRALELFREAGWEIRDGVMTSVETGEPFMPLCSARIGRDGQAVLEAGLKACKEGRMVGL